MKKVIIIALVVVFGLTGCVSKNLNTAPSNDVTTMLDVPESLESCTKDLINESTDCEKMAEEVVCAYYTLTENSDEINKQLEFINACYACSYFGPTGVFEKASRKYSLLGFVKGECQ